MTKYMKFNFIFPLQQITVNFEDLFEGEQIDYISTLKPLPNFSNSQIVINHESITQEKEKIMPLLEQSTSAIVQNLVGTLQNLICTAKDQIRQSMEQKQLFVILEPELNCDPYTDHLKPKNIYPFYQQAVNDALSYVQEVESASIISIINQNFESILDAQVQSRVQTEINLFQETYKTKTLGEYVSYLLDQMKKLQQCLNETIEKSNRAIKLIREQLRLKSNLSILYLPDSCKDEEVVDENQEDDRKIYTHWGNKVKQQKDYIAQLLEIIKNKDGKIALFDQMLFRLRRAGINTEELSSLEQTIINTFKQQEKNEQIMEQKVQEIQKQKEILKSNYDWQIQDFKKQLSDQEIQIGYQKQSHVSELGKLKFDLQESIANYHKLEYKMEEMIAQKMADAKVQISKYQQSSQMYKTDKLKLCKVIYEVFKKYPWCMTEPEYFLDDIDISDELSHLNANNLNCSQNNEGENEKIEIYRTPIANGNQYCNSDGSYQNPKSTLTSNKEVMENIKRMKELHAEVMPALDEITANEHLVQQVEQEIQTIINLYQDVSVQTGDFAENCTSEVPRQLARLKAGAVLADKSIVLDSDCTIVDVFEKLYNQAKTLREKKERIRKEYYAELQKHQDAILKALHCDQYLCTYASKLMRPTPMRLSQISKSAPNSAQKTVEKSQFEIMIKPAQSRMNGGLVKNRSSFAYGFGRGADE